MKIRFWGVRGSIATPGADTAKYGGNTPCVEVTQGKTRLVLDSGTGIRRLGISLESAAESAPLEIHLLLSHCHWDHIQGFPFFLPAFLPKNTIHIYGVSPTEKPLEKVLRGQMDSEYFPVAMGEMAAIIEVHEIRDAEFSIGSFRISTAYMNHPGITLGYRIETPHRILTYATDTEPYRRILPQVSRNRETATAYGRTRDAEILRLGADSDLYIADSQYTPAEYEKKRGWGHTSYTDAVILGIEARAKRLALFSHDPMHDDAAVDEKASRASALAAALGSDLEVFAATEGMEVVL